MIFHIVAILGVFMGGMYFANTKRGMEVMGMIERWRIAVVAAFAATGGWYADAVGWLDAVRDML